MTIHFVKQGSKKVSTETPWCKSSAQKSLLLIPTQHGRRSPQNKTVELHKTLSLFFFFLQNCPITQWKIRDHQFKCRKKSQPKHAVIHNNNGLRLLWVKLLWIVFFTFRSVSRTYHMKGNFNTTLNDETDTVALGGKMREILSPQHVLSKQEMQDILDPHQTATSMRSIFTVKIKRGAIVLLACFLHEWCEYHLTSYSPLKKPFNNASRTSGAVENAEVNRPEVQSPDTRSTCVLHWQMWQLTLPITAPTFLWWLAHCDFGDSFLF